MNLDLSIALVTGASRGIGQGIALALGQAGAKVYGTATTSGGADRITQFLSEHDIKGEGKVLDVADSDSINALVASLGKKEMPSILVNNAGIARDGLLMRMRDEDWNQVINTNLTGVYRLSKACLRAMMKARHGRIITITSVVGLTGNPGQANYAATKAGVIAFSKSLANEVGSRGITVNTVAPGFIETDMTENLSEDQRTAFLEKIPLKRAGGVNDVAQAVVFLASAPYITGETLHVNGGMYMS
ncbi:3-ketoacyl-ACP reductase [Candidatus Thiomargarita nelsonii]|uniref:3-oxoacyl-[acyl-carrier-protein] reductase n=1 Tax=Candidatus Thiomargarita nelsonii TaxID=1003181 RepID=A0A0A6P8J0_9GAMM|nr:3-ketoacyl-ACP reductase [Candidatus Thiomargarita nelsonii]